MLFASFFLLLQVSELYDLVKKWDAVADTLRHIVERMNALKDLHEQGIKNGVVLVPGIRIHEIHEIEK